jgi:hypothetical protein
MANKKKANETVEASKPVITIDNKDYEIETLSDAAKNQITSMRVADQEIANLQQKLALAQTARMAYANALKAELPEV